MSIQKTSKIWKWAKAFFIFLTIMSLYFNKSTLQYSKVTWSIDLILCLLLLVGELFRYMQHPLKKWVLNISIIFSILLSGTLLIFIKDFQPGVIMYFIFLLHEILTIHNKADKMLRVVTMTIHVCVYISYLFYTTYIQIVQMNSRYLYPFGDFNILLVFKDNQLSKIFFTPIFLSGLYLLFLLIFNQIRQKNELENLFTELQDTHQKLKEATINAEELAAAKERNRVAQDIHDSLGHSLTALIMYQEYLEQTFSIDNEKSKDLVIKCQSLTRQAIEDLRKAVYELKQEDKIYDLPSSVNKMISDFIRTSKLNVTFNCIEDVNRLSPGIKEALYRTIKEAITNCIRHGKATEIRIYLSKEFDFLKLKVEDNGCGTEEINKNCGLKGIDERIEGLGGSVKYESKENRGFIIEAFIPVPQI